MFTAGISWLAFGGYTNYGEDVWGRRLNYYLIPILVSKLRPNLHRPFIDRVYIMYMCICWCFFLLLQLLSFAAYHIAAGFTRVFLMAVDTVFICFCKLIVDL